MRRICSKKNELIGNVEKFKGWFKERGYPEDMANKEDNQGHLKLLY